MWCLSKKFDNCFLCSSLLVLDFVGVLKNYVFLIINTICTSIFLSKWHFSVEGLLFHCQLCVGLHFKGFTGTIFCDITHLCFISYPTQESFINLCLIYLEKKINFHVCFDDIFSRCIIFYFGLTFWQLLTNQAISGIVILYLRVIMQ